VKISSRHLPTPPPQKKGAFYTPFAEVELRSTNLAYLENFYVIRTKEVNNKGGDKEESDACSVDVNMQLNL